MQYLMGDFKLSEKMMRFSLFVPRLYNLCRSYGFEKGMIMPSRAFCSDENQGFPIENISFSLVNTQIEFDRAYRTILSEDSYKDKNLAFIAGINIDISPQQGQLFPITKFVPWAAYVQTRGGKVFLLEQEELLEALLSQSTDNPDRIEMSKAIRAMEETPEVKIEIEH